MRGAACPGSERTHELETIPRRVSGALKHLQHLLEEEGQTRLGLLCLEMRPVKNEANRGQLRQNPNAAPVLLPWPHAASSWGPAALCRWHHCHHKSPLTWSSTCHPATLWQWFFCPGAGIGRKPSLAFSAPLGDKAAITRELNTTGKIMQIAAAKQKITGILLLHPNTFSPHTPRRRF